jgi:hypothetical protein
MSGDGFSDLIRDAYRRRRAADARDARAAGLPVVEDRGGEADEPPVDLAAGAWGRRSGAGR